MNRCLIIKCRKNNELWNILGPKISNDFADDEELRSSHIVFTLHVYQYRIEKANQAGLPGGRLTSE